MPLKRSWLAFIPLVISCMLLLFLWRGLYLKPQRIPSALLDKPLPSFHAENLYAHKKPLTLARMRGRACLLHVWASWCLSCRAEHAYLMELAEHQHIAIYGLAYQDKREEAKAWLRDFGDPYRAIALDTNGALALDLGVYGTPETFLVDQNAVIRYKHIGPLTKEVWRNKFLPILKKISIGATG